MTEFLFEQVDLIDDDEAEDDEVRFVPAIGAAVESEEEEPEIIDLFGDDTVSAKARHRRVWIGS